MQGALSCDWASASLVAPAVAMPRGADVVLGDGFADPQRRAAFQPRRAFAPAFNWRFRDVTLLPALGLVFKNGEMLTQTRYGVDARELALAVARLAAPRARLSDRRVFTGFNRFGCNHFHILTQLVPAIAGYAAEPGFRDDLLFAGPGPPGLQRALTLAGVEAPALLPLDPLAAVDVDDLAFSSMLVGGDDPTFFADTVFDRMVASVHAEGTLTSSRMIYVWRMDSPMRPLRNEDALIDMLCSHGVTPVIPGLLSLDEQIALFRTARLVIGPHGAGLANIVFATAGSVMYELLPDHYVNPCMARLAQLRGIHYWADIHRSHRQPGQWRHDAAWSVDVDAVERRLDEILEAYPEVTLGESRRADERSDLRHLPCNGTKMAEVAPLVRPTFSPSI